MSILSSAKSVPAYTESQTTAWLAWLAFQMKKHDQSVFLIENLQPSWLRTDKQRRRYLRSAELVPFLAILFLVGWEYLKLFRTYSDGSIYGICAALFVTPFTALPLWAIWRLITRREKGEDFIKPVEMIRIYWSHVIRTGFMITLIFSLIMFILFAVLRFLTDSTVQLNGTSVLGLIIVFIVMVILSLPAGLMLALSWGIKPGNIEMKIKPNQGILNSGKIAFATAAITIILFLLLSLIGNRIKFISTLSELTPFIGLFAFFRLGGLAVIRHYLLRLTLFRQGCMALYCAHFLDYAANDLNFLQKVGGGYIFVHRYLLEHFAAMEESYPLPTS